MSIDQVPQLSPGKKLEYAQPRSSFRLASLPERTLRLRCTCRSGYVTSEAPSRVIGFIYLFRVRSRGDNYVVYHISSLAFPKGACSYMRHVSQIMLVALTRRCMCTTTLSRKLKLGGTTHENSDSTIPTC